MGIEGDWELWELNKIGVEILNIDGQFMDIPVDRVQIPGGISGIAAIRGTPGSRWGLVKVEWNMKKTCAIYLYILFSFKTTLELSLTWLIWFKRTIFETNRDTRYHVISICRATTNPTIG